VDSIGCLCWEEGENRWEVGVLQRRSGVWLHGGCSTLWVCANVATSGWSRLALGETRQAAWIRDRSQTQGHCPQESR
jgi:hypothetical protein